MLPFFPHLFAMKWWDCIPWSSFFQCWYNYICICILGGGSGLWFSSASNWFSKKVVNLDQGNNRCYRDSVLHDGWRFQNLNFWNFYYNGKFTYWGWCIHSKKPSLFCFPCIQSKLWYTEWNILNTKEMFQQLEHLNRICDNISMLNPDAFLS